jgi:hypothetical protein
MVRQPACSYVPRLRGSPEAMFACAGRSSALHLLADVAEQLEDTVCSVSAEAGLSGTTRSRTCRTAAISTHAGLAQLTAPAALTAERRSHRREAVAAPVAQEPPVAAPERPMAAPAPPTAPCATHPTGRRTRITYAPASSVPRVGKRKPPVCGPESDPNAPAPVRQKRQRFSLQARQIGATAVQCCLLADDAKAAFAGNPQDVDFADEGYRGRNVWKEALELAASRMPLVFNSKEITSYSVMKGNLKRWFMLWYAHGADWTTNACLADAPRRGKSQTLSRSE